MTLEDAQKEIKNLFSAYFPDLQGKVLMATTHHPYSSPPLRLVSSTYLLNKLATEYDIKILYWDYSLPNPVKYREELTFDTGLVKPNSDYFIFKTNEYYPYQYPRLPNFISIKADFEKVLNVLTAMPLKVRLKRDAKYLSNLEALIDLYEQLDYKKNGTDWSVQLLADLLVLCGFPEEAHFLTTHSTSVLLEQRFKQFLVDSILILHNTEFDVFNSLKQIYPTKPVFISKKENHELAINKQNDAIADQNGREYELIELIEMLERNELVPGQYMLPYIFYLASIFEFGKDYGSHDMISQHYEKKTSAFHLPGNDYLPSISFAKGIAFSIQGENIVKISPQKNSRLNTINAIYIHCGYKLREILHEAFENNSVEKFLTMGESFYD